MDITKLFEEFLKEPNKEEKIQVGKLTPEDMLKHRGIQKDFDLEKAELQIIFSRISARVAQVKVKKSEWWMYLYRQYSLSPEKEYSITEEGRIMMVKKP